VPVQSPFDQVEVSDGTRLAVTTDAPQAVRLELSRDAGWPSTTGDGAQPRELCSVREETGPQTEDGTGAREYPDDFSWSHSKDGMLRACARRFGLHYVLSKGGARTDAPPEVREAFRLKQLKSIPTELGSAVHRRAAECANAVIDGLPLPTLDALVERTRAELNALVKSSRNLTAFEKQPSRVPMLREVYYDVDAALRPHLVARARATMLTALETLHRAPLWQELRCIPDPRRNIILPQPFDRFDYCGRHVFAAPDLVFRRPARDGGPSPWGIVDWKVSKTPNYGDTSQIALYGVAVVTAYGWPLVAGCEGRVINLVLDQTDHFELTADDLEDARRRIIDGTECLWSMLMDEAGSPRVLTREDFAMTERTSLCQQCVYNVIGDVKLHRIGD
jgi:hypothetical protein